MGSGGRICLHHPRVSGHWLPDAHAHCSRIQVTQVHFYLISFDLYELNVFFFNNKWCLRLQPAQFWKHVLQNSTKVLLAYRVPQFRNKDSERGELSRITFVFETMCTTDCKFYFLAVSKKVSIFCFLIFLSSFIYLDILEIKFDSGHEYELPLQGYSEWNNYVVEHWTGSSRKQSYSYVIQSNRTVSFSWALQRTEEFSTVRRVTCRFSTYFILKKSPGLPWHFFFIIKKQIISFTHPSHLSVKFSSLVESFYFLSFAKITGKSDYII